MSAFTDVDEKLPTPPVPFPLPKNVAPGAGQFLALSSDATRVAFVRDPEAERFTIDLLPATPGRLVSELKSERTLGPFAGPCLDLQYTAGGSLVFLSGSSQEKGNWTIAVVDPDKNKRPGPRACRRGRSAVTDTSSAYPPTPGLPPFRRGRNPTRTITTTRSGFGTWRRGRNCNRSLSIKSATEAGSHPRRKAGCRLDART